MSRLTEIVRQRALRRHIRRIARQDCEHYGFWKHRFNDPKLQKIYDNEFSIAYQLEQNSDANY